MLSQGINIWGGEQFAPLFGDIKRFFTEIQSSLSQRYTIPTVTLGAADFELEVDALITNEDVFGLLTLTSLTNNNPVAGFGTGAGGTIRMFHRDDIGAVAINVTVPNTGQLSTFGLKYLSGVLTFHMDGALIGTSPVSLGSTTVALNGLGALFRTTTDQFNSGFIANLKITNGTLTHDLRFDEDFGTTSIAVNKGSLGAAGNATAVNITSSELFTLHTDTDPDEWRNFDDTIIIPIAPQV